MSNRRSLCHLTPSLHVRTFYLLSAVVNGTAPAFSVPAAANPSVVPPALPARETNPWAKTPAGAPASAQPGKQPCRVHRQ